MTRHNTNNEYFDANSNAENVFVATDPFSYTLNLKRNFRQKRRGTMRKDYSVIDWQKVLGKYTPNKGYTNYKIEYDRLQRATTNEKRRANLRDAWRAFRKYGISQNKRGLNRALKLTEDNTERNAVKRRFQERMLNTGPVPLPPVYLPKRSMNLAMKRAMHTAAKMGITDSKDIEKIQKGIRKQYASYTRHKRLAMKKALPKFYGGVQEGVYMRHRMSLCKFLQKTFLRKFDDEIKKAAAGFATNVAVKQLISRALNASFAILPYLGMPTLAFVPLVEWKLQKLKKGLVDKAAAFTKPVTNMIAASIVLPATRMLPSTIQSSAAPIGATTSALRAAKASVEKAAEELQSADDGMLNVLGKGLSFAQDKAQQYGAKGVNRIFERAINGLVQRITRDIFGTVRLDPSMLASILIRNGKTVKQFLLGKDISLLKISVDLVDAIPEAQLETAWKKMVIVL